VWCGRRGGLNGRPAPVARLGPRNTVSPWRVRLSHHDAFIIDESAERTVDIAGHRSAANLDELGLGEQV